MTREEMLDILHQTEFRFIDPPSEWEDIGFTERPIWVNTEGYGYVMCDEYVEAGEGDGIPKERWEIIKRHVDEGTLTMEAIKDTIAVDISEQYGISPSDFDDVEEEMKELSSLFSDLPSLPDTAPKHIWWIQDPGTGRPQFFFSEDSFNQAYERDWCDYSWDELDDEALACWIERLEEN